jgi:ankyrin repeat protein
MRRIAATTLLLTIALVASRGASAAGSTGLIDRARAGDAAGVEQLLHQHLNVNEAQPDGTTALHWAAYGGHLGILELLIKAGADVRAVNRYGVTPLSLACEAATPGLAERLLAAGADPNTTSAGHETVLMTAARAGNLDAVKALLARGANPNATEDTRGQTALMWAAAEGHADVIAPLVAAGADLKAVSRAPSEPMAAANASNPPTVANYFARRGRIDAFTPLLFAARAGHLEAVKALIAAGATVDETVPGNGASALVVAISNANYDVASYLLDKGADPNLALQGWTALHQVIRTRTLNIGQFPHPVATGTMSSFELAEKLIAHHADVNARITKPIRDGYRGMFVFVGATPFVLAAKGADAAMMRLLAKHGADPLAATSIHTTALMAAAGVEMYYVEEDSGTNEDALEAVKVALELGGDVNAANDRGETALHGAAHRAANPIVQLLIDKGARLDVKNKEGFTPLMLAHGDRITAGGVELRPETVELLSREMTARGIPIEFRDPFEALAANAAAAAAAEENK